MPGMLAGARGLMTAAASVRGANAPEVADPGSRGLHLTGLCAGYGSVPVLHNVTLSVPNGELVALLGPNGAGKSTLQRSVLGLTEVTAGRITLDGQDLRRRATHDIAAAGVCYIPEGRAIYRGMTVLENLRMFAGGSASRETLDRVFEVFPVLGERQEQLAGTMSGGQQQMVALARTLMRPNTVLLLDELSHGLSPVLVDEIFGVIATLRATGVGILLVEQYAQRALAVADSVYVLVRGSIVFAGEPREIDDVSNVMELYTGAHDLADVSASRS